MKRFIDFIQSLFRREPHIDPSENRVVFFCGNVLAPHERKEKPESAHLGGVCLKQFATLRRHRGMIHQCKLTILRTSHFVENPKMIHPADIQNWKQGTAQLNRWGTVSNFLMVKDRYPYQDVNRMAEPSAPNGAAGVVEIQALRGASAHDVDAAQRYFFPNWDEIEQGMASLPQTVQELADHISHRIRAISIHRPDWTAKQRRQLADVGRDMLWSCSEFEAWAARYIHRINQDEVYLTAIHKAKKGKKWTPWEGYELKKVLLNQT